MLSGPEHVLNNIMSNDNVKIIKQEIAFLVSMIGVVCEGVTGVEWSVNLCCCSVHVHCQQLLIWFKGAAPLFY